MKNDSSRQGLPELLAPVGSEEVLRAAVENGADAVYFGLARGKNAASDFNARARAQNIPLEKLGETMALLRRRQVKGYVTLNTVVRSDELPDVDALLREIAAAGVDALIVQDFGLARLARRLCPDLALHASTQMSLTSRHGIELARSLGIRRIVLPRELSIEQIRRLCESTDLQLECFIHGALCISFSGQCYASLALGGRSANRGRCAQPCRMPYTLLDAKTDKPVPGFVEPRQLLSPCDLASLSLLRRLVDTGIHALKIEGRLKPPEYVAEVTRAYRQALDRLRETNESQAFGEDLNRLELTFSRGFSTGWLEGVDPVRLVPGNVMAHRGAALGSVIEMRRDAVVVKLTASVRRGDGVLFENERSPEKSQGGRVYEIIQRQQSVMEAKSGDRVLLTFANDSINPEYVLPGQSVRKTDDPRLQREIRKSLESQRPGRRIPLDIDVRAVTGEPIRLEVRSAAGASCRLLGDTPLEAARKHPISVETLREQFDRLGETVYSLEKLDAVIEGSPMVPLSVLGKLRREMIEKLDAFEPAATKKAVVFGDLLDTLRREDRTFFDSLKFADVSTSGPILHLLLRDVSLFEDASLLKRMIAADCRSFYGEFKDLDDYRRAAEAVGRHDAEFVAALPRIVKSGEEEFLSKIAGIKPDGVLARNLEELVFFRDRKTPVVADFSLNVVNDLSFRQMIDWGAERIVFGWDLDEQQSCDLLQRVPASKVERVVAGRLPLFTMEHCLWRANLLKPGEPCRNLCRTRPLKIRDRRGVLHTVRSDAFCRNIVENSESLIVETDLSVWKHLRVEWDPRLGDPTPLETLRALPLTKNVVK